MKLLVTDKITALSCFVFAVLLISSLSALSSYFRVSVDIEVVPNV